MTPKEMDKLKEDKDMDGIPDRLDSTFDPPQYRYAQVTAAQCELLEQHHFSFSKYKKKTEDGMIIIRYQETDKDIFQKLVADRARGQAKGGRRN